MIKITYNSKNREIRMKGHANSGEHGKDIICASASMLCYTLAQALKIAEDKKLDDLKIDIKSGKARITCKATEGYDKDVDLMYSTVNAGFVCLAKNYPEFVNFCVMG